MTHNILQTDIELAKGLIASNRPADEVALALSRRGIELAAAAQLVDDLSNGRPVRPQMTAPEFVAATRSSRRRQSTTGQPRVELAQPLEPHPPSQPRPTTDRSSRRASTEKPKLSPVVWFAAGIFGCLLLAAAVFAYKHFQRGRADSQDLPPRNERSATMEAKARGLETPQTIPPSPKPSAPPTAPAAIAIDVRPDGTYLGKALLSKERAWANLNEAYGAPTRTNQFLKGDKLVFAYDKLGILLYGSSPTETDSVVVDFEGSGGTNGTVFPFLGNLQVAGYSIKRNTDSASMTRNLKLEPKPDSLIITAKYDGADVYFSYENSAKLSIVEIGLK